MSQVCIHYTVFESHTERDRPDIETYSGTQQLQLVRTLKLDYTPEELDGALIRQRFWEDDKHNGLVSEGSHKALSTG